MDLVYGIWELIRYKEEERNKSKVMQNKKVALMCFIQGHLENFSD